MSHDIDTIPLDAVRINGGTQSRVELNQATIAEYVELIRAAVDLPPVITFFDGATFWLADGFHRYNAHLNAGAMEITSEIRTGTRRDAILFSVGANASHGLRRTNEDKRRAVATLLNDPEWAAWTDVAIAKACRVSSNFVGDIRRIINPINGSQVRKVERNGTTYEQNTANIGRSPSTADGRPQINEGKQPSASRAAPGDGAPTLIEATLSPADDPTEFGPSRDEIAAAERAEAEQLEYIKNLLASEDDPLAKALADLKQKALEISALRSQNAGHQNKINEQIRMIKSLRSKLDRLEQK